MINTSLREQSSFIAKLLYLLDCLLVIGFLALLVGWYHVEWNIYYTRLAAITFVLCLISFQSFQLYRSWRGWQLYMEFIAIAKAWGAVIGPLLFYFSFSRFPLLIPGRFFSSGRFLPRCSFSAYTSSPAKFSGMFEHGGKIFVEQSLPGQVI